MRNTNKGVDIMTCPCKGCTNREIGCHSKCSKYIEWKAEWDKRKNEICEIKTKERIDREIIRDAIARCAKSRRR